MRNPNLTEYDEWMQLKMWKRRGKLKATPMPCGGLMSQKLMWRPLRGEVLPQEVDLQRCC